MNPQRPVPRTSISLIPPYAPGKRSPGAVKLSSNENPLGCSPRVAPAIREAMQELEVYPDGRSTALARSLAARHSTTMEQIILGNGSDDIMIMAAASFMEPGQNSVMAATTFSQYEFAVRLFGGDVRKVPLAEGTHDLPAMLKAVDADTSIIWICNPNNPTGTYTTQDELESFLSKIPADVLVVLDEAYSEYATADDYPDSVRLLDTYPNLLILHTFSKIHGLAALRLGYGIAAPDIISTFLRVKQPFNVNALAQSAGLAALSDHSFVQHTLEVNRAGLHYLTSELQRLGFQYYPTQANFICIHMPIPAQQAYDIILEFGVTVRSLASFGMERAIRVSIGQQTALESLVQGLEKIRENAGTAHAAAGSGE